ncbi:ABC-2 type transport system permease protein [Nonlabens dokdonensis]|jgi:ABC-2 type transport system permease protein|uniref:Gliding motility permease n=2 Tax=Nonlabens dokdonensis TaxID=328515 RepID=L7WD35_NONDD|nr:gliding motility-associated ABC transporter permease subunit GldF [Nonlabens dokdonensis]AGC77826.1 gliding motility permease [Nonlabens dokdonensis DSW-6]PZX39642.1 ABC-2 type transport system permease protein [Nonlabens dokdonensis]
MKAIFIKELNGFFSSLTGYLVIGIFLIITSLFIFIFKGEYNILDYGFADLAPFFLIIPWLFMFLIPAVTMRSFTVERNLGTLEMLSTRPISTKKLIGGKYLAALVLIIIALIPTLIYVYSLGQLGETPNNLDYGSTFGSYLGAILLAMSYTSIGVFSSTVTSNQIVAFLLAAVLCFIFYFGFDGLNNYLADNDFLASLGLKYHYESMARGVLDTRDVIYFLSVAVLFFALSEISLKTILSKR